MEMEVLGENSAHGGVGGAGEALLGCVDPLEEQRRVDQALADVLGLEGLEERSDGMRCQVKITVRHNLQLRMANHTARDVYVRLLGHGGRISGAGLVALKDSVHLSPLKPSVSAGEAEPDERRGGAQAEAGPADAGVPAEGSASRERPEEKEGGAGRQAEEPPAAEEEEEEEEEAESGTLTISDMVYSPCASMLPTPVEDGGAGLAGGGDGGVACLFQSPGRMLRELHADPEVQRQLRAEREREVALEAMRLAMCRPTHSRWQQLGRWARVAARLAVAVGGLLLLLLPAMLLLLESDLDVAFLHDIRQTPEFQQFHYDYYCPMRRWLLCELDMLLEAVVGD